MYVPSAFTQNDHEQLFALIDAYSFGLLIHEKVLTETIFDRTVIRVLFFLPACVEESVEWAGIVHYAFHSGSKWGRWA